MTCAVANRAGVTAMFAVAAILMLLGAWALITVLLDCDPSLGVYDLQALGVGLGQDRVRWVIGCIGAALLAAGVLVVW